MTDRQFAVFQWSSILLGSLWPFVFGVAFGVWAFFAMCLCHFGLLLWDYHHGKSITDLQMALWMDLPVRRRPRWKIVLDYLERVFWPIWMAKAFLRPMNGKAIQKDIDKGWR